MYMPLCISDFLQILIQFSNSDKIVVDYFSFSLKTFIAMFAVLGDLKGSLWFNSYWLCIIDNVLSEILYHLHICIYV